MARTYHSDDVPGLGDRRSNHNLVCSGPDDPIYKEHLSFISPYRPQPEGDPQIGHEWQLYESDELDSEGNSWFENLSRRDLNMWRLTFEYNQLWCLGSTEDPTDNWLEHTTDGLIDYFLWSETEECVRPPGPRLATFFELAVGNRWWSICDLVRFRVKEASE